VQGDGSAALGLLAELGSWVWFVLWAGLLLCASLLVYVGLGGNFVVLGLAFIHALVTGFDPIGWRLLVTLLILAAVAEGIEFLLGTFYVAKRGASRFGVFGAFAGGLIGAVLGTPLLPVIGSILGSFVGAFVGAILGEYYNRHRLEPSLRIGTHAFLGKMVAILVKHAVGLVMIGLILRATWPAGAPGAP
jgi:uncharacterized protein YqgC (DUF456 family)